MNIGKVSGCFCLFLCLLTQAFAESHYTGHVTNVELTDFFVPIFSDTKVGDAVSGDFSFSVPTRFDSPPYQLQTTTHHFSIDIDGRHWEGTSRFGTVFLGDVDHISLGWDGDSGGGGIFPYGAGLYANMGIFADEQNSGFGRIDSGRPGGYPNYYHIEFSIDPVIVPEPAFLPAVLTVFLLYARRKRI